MKEKTIYEKINEVQVQLLKTELKKSGKNNFSKFSYYELDDILPVIMEKASDQGLMLVFKFGDAEAELLIIDAGNGERFVNVVPVPEIKALNGGMNVIQSEGAFMTYLKRYLLLNTFGICEKSVIDSDSFSQVEQKEKKQKRQSSRQKQADTGFVRPTNKGW